MHGCLASQPYTGRCAMRFMSKWQVGDGICQKYFFGGVGGVYFGPRFVLDTLLVSLMIVETWITTLGPGFWAARCAGGLGNKTCNVYCIGWVWVWYEIQNAKWANECLKTSFLLSCEYLAKATGGFSKVSAIASTAYPAVALSLRAMWQNEALSALHLTDFQPGAQNETYKKYVHISELYGSI